MLILTTKVLTNTTKYTNEQMQLLIIFVNWTDLGETGYTGKCLPVERIPQSMITMWTTTIQPSDVNARVLITLLVADFIKSQCFKPFSKIDS